MPVLLSEENTWLTVVDLEPVYCSYRLYMFECRNRNLQASKMAGIKGFLAFLGMCLPIPIFLFLLKTEPVSMSSVVCLFSTWDQSHP